MPGIALTDDLAQLAELAAKVLRRASRQGLAIVTAESCTGGLLSSLLTDIEGLSGCFDRGFAVYSEAAKVEMLGIEPIDLARHGAVSREIAFAMVRGALDHSRGGLAVSITGFAGPAGSGDEEGLVHLAAQVKGGAPIHRECHFGRRGRDRVRQLAVGAALEMLDEGLIAAEAGKDRL
jgi:nicotinamide-nucleotide amidase